MIKKNNQIPKKYYVPCSKCGYHYEFSHVQWFNMTPVCEDCLGEALYNSIRKDYNKKEIV